MDRQKWSLPDTIPGRRRIFVVNTGRFRSMSIFCQEQIELPSQSAKCNYTEAFLDAAHLKQFYAYFIIQRIMLNEIYYVNKAALNCFPIEQLLEAPPSQERCAIYECQGLLSSSYVVNFMIFYPFLHQHTQKSIKLHNFCMIM